MRIFTSLVIVVVLNFAAASSAQFGGGSSSYNGGAYYGSGGMIDGVVGPLGNYYPGAFYLGGPPGGYGYNPYGYFGYGGITSGPMYGIPYATPSFTPAESLYGPGALRRFIGIDPPLGTPIINQTIVSPPAGGAANNQNFGNNPAPANAAANHGHANGFGVLAVQPPGPGRPNVPTSSAQAQDKARKFIYQGDALFHAQKYADALNAYKDASRTAADLADAHFRQAAADVALNRYDDAIAEIKFGLRLSTSWLDRRFRFAALYGDNRLARTAHLETLAQAATDRPSSDLLFLTGVMLYFDDPPLRSEPFFVRSRQLAVGDTWHVDQFLQSLEPWKPREPGPNADAAKPVEAAKPVLPDLENVLPPQGPIGARDI